MKFVKSVGTIYVAWMLMYYAAIQVHPMVCAPYTLKGFLMSPFMVATPPCIALRWIIDSGATAITSMWAMIGAWCIQRIMSD